MKRIFFVESSFWLYEVKSEHVMQGTNDKRYGQKSNIKFFNLDGITKVVDDHEEYCQRVQQYQKADESRGVDLSVFMKNHQGQKETLGSC